MEFSFPIISLLFVFLISWSLSGIAVLFKSRLLARITREGDHNAVQSAHSVPTPRVGGVGIVVATSIGILLLTNAQSSPLAIVLLISLIPVFAAGFAEDLGYYVSPRNRLLAAGVSAVMMMVLQRIWITSVGVPGMDLLFVVPPLAIVITMVWSAGLCHAFNLIDGVNGLAGSTAIIIGAGLAVIAFLAGDHQIVAFAGVFVAAMIGFQLHNWPAGRIFLGDGGAYSVGHLLAWLGIALVIRNPQVAGISVALLYFWPVADTLWAIYRRRKNGKRTDQPDRMHFHQLVMRTLEIRFGLRGKRHISNALTSTLLSPIVAIPVIIGVASYNRPILGFVAMIALAAAFVLLYLNVVGFASRRKTPYLPSREAEAEESVQIAAE